MNVAQETLGLRRAGLSPALSLLMSAFALPIPPAHLSVHLHRPRERSPTMHALPLIYSPCLQHDARSCWGALSWAFRARKACRNKLRWSAYIHSFGAQFEPRYIFRAGRLDQ